jgi:hypothetical protein
MSVDQHTVGPYEIREFDEARTLLFSPPVYDGKSKLLATVSRYTGKHDSPQARVESTANVHLFHAAPELYNACAYGCEHGRIMDGPELLEFIADRLLAHGDTVGVGPLRHKAALERAALARARGVVATDA